MKSSALLVLLPILILTGCTTNRAKLDKAATTIGQSKAHVLLPAWPAECRRVEAHATLSVGQSAVSVLKREREALRKQNARTALCAGFYDNLAERLK